jgi:hypothetical protein
MPKQETPAHESQATFNFSRRSLLVALFTVPKGLPSAGVLPDARPIQSPGIEFSLNEIGNNLILDFTPVPEPSAWALLGLGVLALIPVIVRRWQRAETAATGRPGSKALIRQVP